MSGIVRHCGVVRSTGSRVYVVMRSLIDHPEFCLVVYQDSLPEVYAHEVNRLVMNEGQRSIELYDVMDKVGILDRKNMLTVLHKMSYLRKQNTSDIDMMVGGTSKIPLNLLNQNISTESLMSDGKVKNYNPFSSQSNEVDYPEQTGIVSDLIKEATKHKELSQSMFERAYNLDPSLRPQSEAKVESNTHIHVEFPIGTTQSKAIELVKRALKEHKGTDAGEK